MLALLLISAQSLLARHKDQVFIKNETGQELHVTLNWLSKSYGPAYKGATQPFKLRSNNNIATIKAPSTKPHTLKEIEAYIIGAPKVKNKIKNVQSNVFFVIDYSHEIKNNLDINPSSNLKKIVIQGYPSKELYEQAVTQNKK